MMAKRPFSMNYKTYDTRDGFGTEREWRQVFAATMGLDEARRRVGNQSPEAILGVGPTFTLDALKSAYRRKARETHPDFHPDDPTATERFKQVNAAYVVLEARLTTPRGQSRRR